MTGVWEEIAPSAERTLDPEHRRILTEESGITDDIIDQRGYHSLDKRQVSVLVARNVINSNALNGDGWMSIPIYRPDGSKHCEVLRVFGTKLSMKYIWPTGVRQMLDIHPSAKDHRTHPEIPLIITEGVKKADAILSAARKEGIEVMVAAVNGCWGWRSKVKLEGGKHSDKGIPLEDFHDILLEGRQAYVLSDSDFRTNDDVASGWTQCANYLESKTGRHRTLLVVVPPEGLHKQGADDFLARGQLLVDLLGLGTTPRQAGGDDGSLNQPLLVKTARQLIAEARDVIPHLVTPLVPEQGIVVMAGHSSTYKTWHALGLALDGAAGLPWLGHPDLGVAEQPFTTLYVNKEMGSVLISNRMKMMAKNERYAQREDFDSIIDERVLVTCEAALDLVDPIQRTRLEEAIIELDAHLVILDSFSMCWTGDENSNSEVGTFYAHLRGITERTGVTWVIIHHLLKPQGNRAQDRFAVRGAGQILQQADSVLMFTVHGEAVEDGLHQEVAISQVKSRTAANFPAFVSSYSDHDGFWHDVSYTGKLSDLKAKALATGKSHDPVQLSEWVEAAMMDMPAMSPTNSGLRAKALTALLQAAWPVENKDAPSETVIRNRLVKFVEEGVLELVETNKRHGDLYRFSAPSSETD